MAREMFCGGCGQLVRPMPVTKGSFGLEFLLWICFLLPGLIYSVWRLASRYNGCPKCKSPNLLPHDSPMARMLQQQMSVVDTGALGQNKSSDEANRNVSSDSVKIGQKPKGNELKTLALMLATVFGVGFSILFLLFIVRCSR